MVSAILVLIKDFLTTSALYNIMIQQTILLIAPIGHQFGDESLCEDLVEIRGSIMAQLSRQKFDVFIMN